MVIAIPANTASEGSIAARNRALTLMREEFQPSTWRAFWECAAEDRPAAEVADRLRRQRDLRHQHNRAARLNRREDVEGRGQNAQALPPISELLKRKGFASAEEVNAFLQPRLSSLSDPFLLPDMAAAVRLAAHDMAQRLGPGKRLHLLGYSTGAALAVVALARRYGVEPERIIVVHDELDLPVAALKVKSGGGLAGHNGLRSIVAHLHSDAFVRVRIGVDKPASKEQGVEHVLKRFSKRERTEIDVTLEQAADAVECIVGDGIDDAMNRYN
jgi:hypothetical protein